jgi:hypothetical protein
MDATPCPDVLPYIDKERRCKISMGTAITLPVRQNGSVASLRGGDAKGPFMRAQSKGRRAGRLDQRFGGCQCALSRERGMCRGAEAEGLETIQKPWPTPIFLPLHGLLVVLI